MARCDRGWAGGCCHPQEVRGILIVAMDDGTCLHVCEQMLGGNKYTHTHTHTPYTHDIALEKLHGLSSRVQRR